MKDRLLAAIVGSVLWSYAMATQSIEQKAGVFEDPDDLGYFMEASLPSCPDYPEELLALIPERP